jgi:hypothetical protein
MAAMTMYDESGYKAQIEDIFHELTQRLFDIEYQIERGKEITIESADVLKKVREQITSYPYDKALAILQTNLTHIEQLLRKIDDNKDGLIIQRLWPNKADEGDKASTLNAELNNYKEDILFLINRFEKNQGSYLNNLSNVALPKIDVNLTAEYLGGLLHFLLRHQSDLINTKATDVCTILSKVITIRDSSSPNPSHLYNMMFKAAKKEEIIEFWRKKFNSYYNHPLQKSK